MSSTTYWPYLLRNILLEPRAHWVGPDSDSPTVVLGFQTCYRLSTYVLGDPSTYMYSRYLADFCVACTYLADQLSSSHLASPDRSPIGSETACLIRLSDRCTQVICLSLLPPCWHQGHVPCAQCFHLSSGDWTQIFMSLVLLWLNKGL